MRFELSTDRIKAIDEMLSQGLRLRAIAKRLHVSESTLRWQIAKVGYKVDYTGKLIPIHAPALDQEHAA